jgi:hypothetical protein
VKDIVQALEDSYNHHDMAHEPSIKFASAYNADTVFKSHWEPAMAVLA